MGYVIADLFKDTPSYADMAAKGERQRQALINLGQQQIDAVFGGGTAPFYNVYHGGFDPSASYYRFNNKGFAPYYTPDKGGAGFNKQGKPKTSSDADIANAIKLGAIAGSVVPVLGTAFGASVGGITASIRNKDVGGMLTGGLSSLFGGDKESPMDAFKRREKKGDIFSKQDATFEGFTPDFYNQRAQAYIDFALPQLAKQYRDTSAQIGFGLANRGLAGSSAARRQYSDLSRTNQEARQGIADSGRAQAQDLERQVNDYKNNLINQLYQSADPARGVSQAISGAASFQQPSTFAPLANAFTNLINQYYTSKLLNPQSGGYGQIPYYGSGLNTGALPTNYTVSR